MCQCLLKSLCDYSSIKVTNEIMKGNRAASYCTYATTAGMNILLQLGNMYRFTSLDLGF